MLKQLAKRVGMLAVMSFLYGVNIKAQDDYLVGVYYYPWYHENSWFRRGLTVATDSILHDTSYYRNFVTQQYYLLLNRPPDTSGLSYYIDRMQAGWRQDNVIRDIGKEWEYFNVICNSQNSLFVDSISWDLMGTYRALLDSLNPGFRPWCVNQLDSGEPRENIIDTMLHRAEQYKHFIDTTYYEILGRHADPGGLEHWTLLMEREGLTKDGIIKEICSSSEYLLQW